MRWRDLLHLNQIQPLPTEFFQTPRRVHFIGVGGIGMSALALLLNARGHSVFGSDASDSAMLAQLREAGISCFVGQKAENVDDAEAIFYSSAISPENPEFAAATQNKIPAWHRSQLLAHFVNNAKTSIAVSGTHGKSTTSAMIAHILTECGQNPTAVLGAIYPPFDSNLRVGNPDLIVVEADESDGSFTLLKPTVAVVLNVEPEHLENYDE
ncbi:MAG TPA: Mur ligase domain-containing protein, partial [Abditibacterium sp.]